MSEGALHVGDWVEVRSKAEILRTLDGEGCLDGMPFMPEMFAYCGRRMQVWKSAHKTCDTVFPVRSRRLDNTFHLQTRCNGSAHGGCQAGCLLFWNGAWLKPAAPPSGSESPIVFSARDEVPPAAKARCQESDVIRATRLAGEGDDEPTYVCQATRLPYASQDLSPFDPRQYVRDLTSGNVRFGAWLHGIVYITYHRLISLGIGWGPLLSWLYDRIQSVVGGVPYPRRTGVIAKGQPTPSGELGLEVGDWVRVKSYKDILATCNVENRNRGLYFDAEHVPYCGQVHRVQMRVMQIINENTGKMMPMKNPCIVLEDAYCRSRYSDCRMFCARAIHLYWREIWLERVPAPQAQLHAGAVGGIGQPLASSTCEGRGST
jgi:hypothetical protein